MAGGAQVNILGESLHRFHTSTSSTQANPPPRSRGRGVYWRGIPLESTCPAAFPQVDRMGKSEDNRPPRRVGWARFGTAHFRPWGPFQGYLGHKKPRPHLGSPRHRTAVGTYEEAVSYGRIVLPNNQRQHRIPHAPKDMLPLRICAKYCAPRQPLLRAFPGWIRSPRLAVIVALCGIEALWGDHVANPPSPLTTAEPCVKKVAFVPEIGCEQRGPQPECLIRIDLRPGRWAP